MTDRDRLGLKGLVQEYRLLDFCIHKTEPAVYIKELSGKNTYLFYENGYLQESSNRGEQYFIRHLYSYDPESGLLIQEDNLFGDTTFSSHKYKYDSKNRLIEKLSCNFSHVCDNKTVYQYDENSLLTEESDFHLNDLLTRHCYEYNQKMERISHTVFIQKGFLAFKHVMEYGVNGKISRRMVFELENGAEACREDSEYYYNEVQDIREQRWKAIGNDPEHRHFYEYNYDKQGNRLKTTVYSLQIGIQEMIHYQESELIYY